MSATKAPRTLSSYQYHMQSVLRDKKTSFSDAVTQWKGLDDKAKAALKEKASQVPTKVKGGGKKANQNFMKEAAPKAEPTAAPKAAPKAAPAKVASEPAPVPTRKRSNALWPKAPNAVLEKPRK